METKELSAWHESGRVVVAYQCGFTCDGIELSETDSGNGKSKLNGGQDLPYIQAILSGKSQPVVIENPEKAIDVAKKLMKIYCAGSCAKIYYENNGKLNAETEIDIPGQDLRSIELIEQFLSKHDKEHPEDYMNKTMVQLFREMKTEETWKPLESLARQLLKTEEKPFTRFNIEDALMMGGFKLQKRNTGNSFGFSVKEDNQPAASVQNTRPNADVTLDKTLQDFLMMVKQDWSAEEMKVSVDYLKNVFKKFSKN